MVSTTCRQQFRRQTSDSLLFEGKKDGGFLHFCSTINVRYRYRTVPYSPWYRTSSKGARETVWGVTVGGSIIVRFKDDHCEESRLEVVVIGDD